MQALIRSILTSLVRFFPVFLACCLVWGVPVLGAEVDGKAGATSLWTPERARAEIFSDVQRILDVRLFAEKDPDFEANQLLIRQGTLKKGERVITPSGEGFYSVRIAKGPTLYYSSRGNLKAVEVTEIRGALVKSFNYLYGSYAERLGLNSGQLLFANLKVSADEQFVFDTTGRMHAHWLKGNCSRPDGTSCK